MTTFALPAQEESPAPEVLFGASEKGMVPIAEAVEFAKKLCADKLSDIARAADAITEPF